MTKLGRRWQRFDAIDASLVGLWVYAVVCQLWVYAVNGRTTVSFGLATAPAPQVVTQARSAIVVLVAIILAVSILRSLLNRSGPSRRFAILVAALAPGATLGLSAIGAGLDLGLNSFVFALLAVAAWLRGVGKQTLRLLAALGALTAVVSVVLAVTAPELVLVARGTGSIDEKAIIGSTLLAGPFAAPNTLGTAMLLLFPMVAFLRTRLMQVVAGASIVLALTWSASRTSLAAWALLLLVGLLFKVGARWVLPVVVASLAILGLVLPFQSQSADDFTGRGRIWAGSIAAWREAPWLGQGPDYYSTAGQFINDMGRTAFHGHNMWVNALATGGLLHAFTVLVLLLAVTIQAYRLRLASLAAWVVGFAASGILEVVLDVRNPGNTAWVAWIALCAVLFARRRAVATTDEARGALFAQRTPTPLKRG